MAANQPLNDLCGKTYKEQAVWFLNCFWDQTEKDAELIWNYVLRSAELDLESHETGCALDEMKAHVFLEKFDETLTVREMRAKLRSTGAIGEAERPKTVPLTHYLLYKYNVDWKVLIDETRQGSNKEELAKAEKMLAEVQAAFRESEQKASIARKALLEAQSAEKSAKAREQEATASAETAKTREAQALADAESCKAREAEAKAAQQELEAALAEVKAQEDAYNQKKADLELKSTQGGVVSQNKAKAELAQHLAEDPLPLRRAKITQEAAVKKAERATNAAAAARQAADASAAAASEARQKAEADAKAATAARQSAEAAARASEKASAEAEAALEAAVANLKQAEEYLAEVRSRPGQSFGALWWIDRELHEQKKYIPESKGGIRK